MKELKFSWNKIFLLAVILPIPIILINIFSGSMPFWFDPARDFLAALSNQHKITLIGQPTGIPGLFYGPYWIWLLSLALLLSKDPRIVQFLVLGLPYMIVFPIVLYKFKEVFDLKIITALYLLFAFSFMRYAIFPWNPHLAPLFVLIVFCLLIFKKNDKRGFLYVFFAGLFSGLIGNFHISFDIGLVAGIFVYFLIFFLKKISAKNFKIFVTKSVLFVLGFILAFSPFFIFEARHGFFQTKTALTTFFSPYAVVGLKGITPNQILGDFISIPAQLTQLPLTYGNFLFIFLVVVLGWILLKKKQQYSENEKNLLILCLSIIACVLFVFFSSKNPVWDYHFIAMEIPFLLIIGLIMKKIYPLKTILLIWAVFILVVSYYTFFLKERPSVLSYDSLAKKEYIVNLVKKDAIGKNYTVFAYNPAIYTYDYSYLFGWLAGKDVPYDPGQIRERKDTIYLIIQKTDSGIFQDYINAHAPDNSFKTTKTWEIEDGTQVLKRESLKKQ